MHQVEVEIRHADRLKLAFKQRADLRLRIEVMGGQLVGDGIALPRVAAREANLQRRLRFAGDVAVRRVEIRKAAFHKPIHHFCEQRRIDLAVFQKRQAHASEPEFFASK